jgi:DNA-binding NtrC family response regulator
LSLPKGTGWIEPVASVSPSIACRRILCVDDDPEFLRNLNSSLSLWDLEVVIASPGIDAYMQYRSRMGDFHAIVTGNGRTGRQGLELIRWIRSEGFCGRIVLIMEGFDLRLLREYADCKLGGFFTKPFDTSLLATLLMSDR